MKNIELFEGFIFNRVNLEKIIKDSKQIKRNSYVFEFDYKGKHFYFEFTEIDERPKTDYISFHMKLNSYSGVYSVDNGEKKNLDKIEKVDMISTIENIVKKY
jgi:hypothetical protein